MSTSLYWSYRPTKEYKLPLSLKQALERVYESRPPSIEWLRGFLAGLDRHSEDAKLIEQLIDVWISQEGNIDFSIHE